MEILRLCQCWWRFRYAQIEIKRPIFYSTTNQEAPPTIGFGPVRDWKEAR